MNDKKRFFKIFLFIFGITTLSRIVTIIAFGVADNSWGYWSGLVISTLLGSLLTSVIIYYLDKKFGFKLFKDSTDSD